MARFASQRRVPFAPTADESSDGVAGYVLVVLCAGDAT